MTPILLFHFGLLHTESLPIHGIRRLPEGDNQKMAARIDIRKNTLSSHTPTDIGEKIFSTVNVIQKRILYPRSKMRISKPAAIAKGVNKKAIRAHVAHPSPFLLEAIVPKQKLPAPKPARNRYRTIRNPQVASLILILQGPYPLPQPGQ